MVLSLEEARCWGFLQWEAPVRCPLLLEFAELFKHTCWAAPCQLGLWGGFFTPLGEPKKGDPTFSGVVHSWVSLLVVCESPYSSAQSRASASPQFLVLKSLFVSKRVRLLPHLLSFSLARSLSCFIYQLTSVTCIWTRKKGR